MAGELWREQIRIAKEVTAGTPVSPATRKLYLRDVAFTKERASRPHRFATGTRANVLAHTQGPVMAGGRVSLEMSGSEILEWCLLGLQGGVSPTTPGGATNSRLWTFVPSGTTLDSATLERNDGAQIQQLAGVRVDRMTIAGNVREANTVTCELFATNRDDTYAALTGSPAERVPTFQEGWQTNFYATAFAGTPGAGALTDFLIAWEVVISNNLRRRYFANNTLAASRVDIGVLDITANLTFDSSHASYLTEVANWLADTKRLVRLEFLGPANGLETGFREFVTIDLAGAWMTPDVNQADENARAGRFPLTYVYDPTNALAVQLRAQSLRTAAY